MIITQTPLRISFLGGNTDFAEYYKKHGGAVLATAIDKYIYCIITPRFDDKIYVNWSKKEIVDSVDQIEHELVREALKKVGISKGVEISFLADVPSEGSGLGSSSAVLVGVLNALYQYSGQTISAERLAKEACEIEIDILKKPIGIQDQYVCAYGGLGLFEFNKNGSVKVNRLTVNNGVLEDFDNSLMLFYTGRTRKSSAILAELKNKLDHKTKALNFNKKMAYQGYKNLAANKFNNIGKLLSRYWDLKRSLVGGVTNLEIDQMYARALGAGAIGGKIAGAGGGGFMLLMVPSEKREKVRAALKDFRELPFRIGVDGSKVIFNIHRP